MNTTTDGLTRFNRMSCDDAEAALLACCASPNWARAVAALRPYTSAEELYDSADRIWSSQPETEWEIAFSAHPRIGEASAKRPQHGAGDRWSAQEQSGALTAETEIHDRLAAINRAYSARFGRTYIVCASGKSAMEMLEIAEQRMNNDPATELGVTAMEQSRITRLRLERTLTELTDQHA